MWIPCCIIIIKKILDGLGFWEHDLFTECDIRVFRKWYVDIHTAPVTSYFPSYLCCRRVALVAVLELRNIRNTVHACRTTRVLVLEQYRVLSVRFSTPGRHLKTFGFDVAEGLDLIQTRICTGKRIRSQIWPGTSISMWFFDVAYEFLNLSIQPTIQARAQTRARALCAHYAVICRLS